MHFSSADFFQGFLNSADVKLLIDLLKSLFRLSTSEKAVFLSMAMTMLFNLYFSLTLQNCLLPPDLLHLIFDQATVSLENI